MEEHCIEIADADVFRMLLRRRFLTVQLVALVQGREVALDGQLPVHRRVLRTHFRFVKIVNMLDVSRTKTAFQN